METRTMNRCIESAAVIEEEVSIFLPESQIYLTQIYLSLLVEY
jgi:hypothetical protein